MYHFLDRFIHMTCPRIKHFKGFSFERFDQKGNLNIHMRELMAFYELEEEYTMFSNLRDLSINIVTSGNNSDESLQLLQRLRFPITKNKK